MRIRILYHEKGDVDINEYVHVDCPEKGQFSPLKFQRRHSDPFAVCMGCGEEPRYEDLKNASPETNGERDKRLGLIPNPNYRRTHFG